MALPARSLVLRGSPKERAIARVARAIQSLLHNWSINLVQGCSDCLERTGTRPRSEAACLWTTISPLLAALLPVKGLMLHSHNEQLHSAYLTA